MNISETRRMDRCEAEIKRLKAEVARLELLQYRQAPCHKFCESQAYKIEARGFMAEIEQLKAAHDVNADTLNAMQAEIEQRDAEIKRKDAALRYAKEALRIAYLGGSRKAFEEAVAPIDEALK